MQVGFPAPPSPLGVRLGAWDVLPRCRPVAPGGARLPRAKAKDEGGLPRLGRKRDRLGLALSVPEAPVPGLGEITQEGVCMRVYAWCIFTMYIPTPYAH